MHTKSTRIKLTVGGTQLEAELLDTKLAVKIVDILPLQTRVMRWGDEIYFEIPVQHTLEKPTLNLEVGDLAYWSQGQCLCIFYGKTPASTNDKPRPASEVEKIGKILDDAEKLKTETTPTIKIEKTQFRTNPA